MRLFISNYLIYTLLFLVSFVAGNGILNENIYIKQFAFGVAFVAMTVVNLFLPQKHGEIRVKWGDVFVAALLVVYLCFYIGTNNNLDFIQPFICFLFYLFMRMQAEEKPEEAIQALCRIVPMAMLLHVLCCVLQFFKFIPSFHGYFQVGSTFGNPDMLGTYLAILSPFCYVGKGKKIFGIIVLCLVIILLLLIQARTAIVAIAVAGILYLLQSGKLSKKIFFFWILPPLVVGLALLVWWHPASVAGRLFIWWIALNMFISRPLGWGLFAFEKHYLEFQADYVARHDIPAIFTPDIVNSSYNEFLNVGVTLGIGGLLLFLLFVAFALFAVHKAKSPLLYPLCAFLIVSLTYFPLSIVPVAVIGVAFAALAISHCSTSLVPFNLSKKWLFIPIVAPVMLLTWNNYHSYRQWQTAFSYGNDGQYDESNIRFAELYPTMKGNGRFLITWANVQRQVGDSVQCLQLMKEAEQFFCDNIFLGNLALLYEQNGQVEEARICFEKAVNMIPDHFNIAYNRILFLQRIGQEEEAYQAAVKLYNQPVRSKYYADPFIIKARLKKLIQSKQEQ